MPADPRHPLVDIKDALSEFVAKESELAAAEIKPAAKAAGIGVGFFGGAVVFLLHAVWMLVIVIGLGVGLLLHALTPLGPWGSFTLGFTASMLISILIAVILITLGRGKFKDVKKPEATIAEAKATVDAVVSVIASRTSDKDVVIKPDDLPQFRDARSPFARP